MSVLQPGKWEPEEKKELERIIYRLAWKWAVLAHYVGKVYQGKGIVLKKAVKALSDTKTMIDSGCYSACEIMTELRKVEVELFPHIIEMGEADRFLDMLSKAIAGKLRKEDVDISVAKPVIADCSFPCVCDREVKPI